MGTVGDKQYLVLNPPGVQHTYFHLLIAFLHRSQDSEPTYNTASPSQLVGVHRMEEQILTSKSEPAKIDLPPRLTARSANDVSVALVLSIV